MLRFTVSSICWLLIHNCVLCCSWTVGAVYGQDIDSSVWEELRRSAVPSWKQIESSCDCFQGQYEQHYKVQSPGKPDVITKSWHQYAYCLQSSRAIYRSGIESEPTGITHQVLNETYAFDIYAVNKLEKGKLSRVSLLSDAGDDRPIDIYDQGQLAWVKKRLSFLKSTHVGWASLGEIIFQQDGGFQLVSLQRVLREGFLQIEVRAVYTGVSRLGRVLGGRYLVYLDPANSYQITHWKIVDKDVGRELLEDNDYTAVDSATPRVIAISRHQNNSSSGGIEIVNTYSPIDSFSVPEAEFYLPHYGFSEEVLESLAPNPWPRWLLIGGGTVAIALAAWLLRKRHAPHVAGSAAG